MTASALQRRLSVKRFIKRFFHNMLPNEHYYLVESGEDYDNLVLYLHKMYADEVQDYATVCLARMYAYDLYLRVRRKTPLKVLRKKIYTLYRRLNKLFLTFQKRK
jgi:hypothetical protein